MVRLKVGGTRNFGEQLEQSEPNEDNKKSAITPKVQYNRRDV
jgi:hypothetical protein